MNNSNGLESAMICGSGKESWQLVFLLNYPHTNNKKFYFSNYLGGIKAHWGSIAYIFEKFFKIICKKNNLLKKGIIL